MIEIISATRLSETDFWNNSALGQSLLRLTGDSRLSKHITFSNTRGLPDIFNARITSSESCETLVFIHDDVWIDDYFIVDRVASGLQSYDIIGVAGNRRRLPYQPSWAFVDCDFKWDEPTYLSGSVAHGAHPFGPVSHFGPTPADCILLDGVFLAAKKSTLTSNGVFFDTQFDFHFYDLDFCRNAIQRGLKLGTWPICITHQSGGAFGTERWLEKFRAYIEKWDE